MTDCVRDANPLTKGGTAYAVIEFEAYVHSAAHADPYTHSDPGQGHCGVWYFHRTGPGNTSQL
eukprot:2398074-Amphidinium_carterae.2